LRKGLSFSQETCINGMKMNGGSPMINSYGQTTIKLLWKIKGPFGPLALWPFGPLALWPFGPLAL
jgi:hypothetical protein